MTAPTGPRELDWPELLDLAARVAVRVCRLAASGNLVPVDRPPRATPQAPRATTGADYGKEQRDE